MSDLSGFNANDHDPDISFSAIPAGEYRAVISNAEWKRTKAGTGRYLELTFQIIEGPHQNRLLWSRLNLDHPNPDAVEFAKRELAAICRAVGVEIPEESARLLNIPLTIKVSCKTSNYSGELENRIRAYSRLGAA